NSDHLKRVENLLKSHQKLAQTLLSSDLDSMLEDLERMLGTQVALTLHGEVISGDFDPARSWHSRPVATGLRDKCTLHIADPYVHQPVVDYAQSLIGLELANKARLRASQRQANGQVLEDLAAGTLVGADRSEERRVGKEGSGRRTPRGHQRGADVRRRHDDSGG